MQLFAIKMDGGIPTNYYSPIQSFTISRCVDFFEKKLMSSELKKEIDEWHNGKTWQYLQDILGYRLVIVEITEIAEFRYDLVNPSTGEVKDKPYLAMSR